MENWLSRYFFLFYGLLVLSWSSAFPLVKIGLSYSPPLFFAGMRTLLGGLFLLLPALWLGGELAPRRLWPHWLWTALFLAILFFGLQTYAVYYLPSGLTAVLIYLQPILVGWLAHFWLGERLTWNKTAGLVCGFAGVMAVSWEGVADSLSLAGILVGIGGAASWAVGTVYVKRIQHQVALLWLLVGQFIVGGLVLLLLSAVFDDWSAVSWNGTFVATLLYTALVSISIAWVLYFVFMERGEASRVAANMFLVPLVSVLLGVIFLKETISVFFLLGGGLIVAGIYLVNRRFSPAAHKQRIDGKSTYHRS